jgi:uncharacterized protein (DUF433 family)
MFPVPPWRVRLVGQDTALSRPVHGFESRTRCHLPFAIFYRYDRDEELIRVPRLDLHLKALTAIQTLNYSPDVDYSKIITIEPGKRSGKPCIRGMRITVQDIFEYLAGGMTEDQILKDFPELTREDINACFAFAADRERK